MVAGANINRWSSELSHAWHDLANSIREAGSTLWVNTNSRLASNNNPLSVSEELPQSITALEADKQFGGNSAAITGLVDTNAWQQTMKSIDALNKQSGALSEDPSYHNRLGILYAQIGDFSAALKQFNRSIVLCHKKIWQKTHPSNTNGAKTAQPESFDLSMLYVNLSCAHSNLARIYDKLGDHDRVIAELEELNNDIAFAGDLSLYRVPVQKPAAIVAPSPVAAVPAPVHYQLSPAEAAILARGEALREVGRLPEAMQEYKRLIRLNPNIAIAHQRLGLAAAASGDLWMAMNELQTAAVLDNKDADTENDLGLVYLQMGDSQLAKQAFWQAHLTDPQHLDASINLADSLASTGNLPSALNVMQQAVVDHPMSAGAHNNLGAILAKLGNDKQAAKEFSGATSLNPALASAHYGLGVALLNLKSYPEASRELNAAMRLNPGYLDLPNKIDLANRNNTHSPDVSQELDN